MGKMRKYWELILELIREPNIWIELAKLDLKSRFRGSILGPFWSVLNIGHVLQLELKLVELKLILLVYLDLNFTILCQETIQF